MTIKLKESDNGRPFRGPKRGAKKNCIHYCERARMVETHRKFYERGEYRIITKMVSRTGNYCRILDDGNTCGTLRRKGACPRTVREWNAEQ